MITNDERFYTVAEVAKALNRSTRNIANLCTKGIILAKKENTFVHDQWFISEQELNRLRLQFFGTVNPLMSPKEVSIKLSCEIEDVIELCENRQIQAEPHLGSWLIPIAEICAIKKYIDYSNVDDYKLGTDVAIELGYSINQVYKQYKKGGVRYKKVNGKLWLHCNDISVLDEYLKKAYGSPEEDLMGNNYIFPIELATMLSLKTPVAIHNMIFKNEIHAIKIAVGYRIHIDEAQRIVNLYEQFTNKSKFVTLSEAIDRLNINSSTFYNYRKGLGLEEGTEFLGVMYYPIIIVNKVEESLALRRYSPVDDIRNCILRHKVFRSLKIGSDTLEKFCKEFKIQTLYYKGASYLYEEDYEKLKPIVEQWKQEKLEEERTFKNIDNVDNLILFMQKNYLNDFEHKHNKERTKNLINTYTINEFSNSQAKNKKKTLLQKLGPAMKLIIIKCMELDKEVFQLTSYEIEQLISCEMPDVTKLYLGYFLNYVKKELGYECCFINLKIEAHKHNRGKVKSEDDIYPLEIFRKMVDHSVNIDLHKNHAIKSPQYAQIWLYILLHFNTAWRQGDVREIPSIDLVIINEPILTLDWFEKNNLSEYQCECIISYYLRDKYFSHKSGTNIPFQIFTPFKEAFATCITICELHRVAKDEEMVFFLYKDESPPPHHYKKFLKMCEHVDSISGLKMNRSLMHHLFEFIKHETKYYQLAYAILKKLRGHVDLSTTAIYLQQALKEGQPVETISKYLFDIDNFGFVYYALAEVILLKEDNVNVRNFTISEKAQLISSMKENTSFSIYELEALHKSMLRQIQIKEERTTVINKLMGMEQIELKERLAKIYAGMMPSKEIGIQCFLLMQCENDELSNEYTLPCKYCKWAIPNKMFLISLNMELHKKIDKVTNFIEEGSLSYFDIQKLYNRDIGRLLDLLREAWDSHTGLGKNVVKAYINRKDISEKLVYIEKLLIERSDSIGQA